MESQKTMGVCIQKIASKMQKPLGGKGLNQCSPGCLLHALIVFKRHLLLLDTTTDSDSSVSVRQF